MTIGACLAAASPAQPAGFAPANQTLFAPVVQLAPPGPARAARAVAIFDRQLAFHRKFAFHPEIDAALARVVDELPLRQSTVIRAAALYGRRSIPWNRQPDGTHQLCVTGTPRTADYLYTLTGDCRNPQAVHDFSGRCALRPAGGSTVSVPASVLGTFDAELLLDTGDLGALVDVLAAVLAQCYGTLLPPWDTAPDAFNQHDRAVLERMHREMPLFAGKLDEYLQFHNVLDEFASAAGPLVLYNLDVEVRPEALRKYPRLADFYGTLVAAMTVESVLLDVGGNHWLHAGFERGHFRLTFLLGAGRLTPFDAALQPAGDGVALETVDQGRYRSLGEVRVSSLGMSFGLANIGFATTYRREPNLVAFESRMDTVPQLVAPPVIHQAMDLVAGTFLRLLATGQGGLSMQVRSQRLATDRVRFAGSSGAELEYAPTLGFLARIGDALANQHDAEVRAEERALAEEVFDAFVADYAAARAAILALDGGNGE